MRRLSVLLLSVSMILSACKKESPVELSDTTPPTSSGAVVIGPSGGAVSCTGFSLIIPAAAFSGPETLTVKEETYTGEFGSSNITAQYRLEGLPPGFAGRIQLAMKCTGTGTGGSFIAMGIEGMDPVTGEPASMVQPLGAVLDSGFLKTALTPAGVVGPHGGVRRVRGGGVKLARWFVGLNEMDTLVSSGKHFRIFYRRYNIAPAQSFLQYLEEAYTSFQQMGFGTPSYDRIRWPIDVSMCADVKFEGQLVCGTVVRTDPVFYWPRVGLACNEDRCGSPPYVEFRKWLIAEFGFLLAVVNDPFFFQPYGREDAVRIAPRIWPYSAISQWASTHSVPSGADSLPPLLPGRMLTPLLGLAPSPGALFAPHGLGMVGVMRHLAAQYGERTLADIFRAIPTLGPSETAIDLLFDKLPEEENIWWPAFMRRYLSGEIYGIPADTLLKEMQSTSGSREFTVAGRRDTVKYFSEQYRDLSAKLYRVNLRYADISPTATITFEVGPKSLNLNYVHVMLFGLKNHKLEYWETGNTIAVSKLKELTAGGYDIVAAVINSANEPPYTGTMAIDLDIRITSEVLALARIKVRTSGTTTYNDGSVSQSSLVLYNSINKFREGTLLNGLFTAQWDTTIGSYRDRGSWTIQFDFSTTPVRVTYFKAEETESATDTEVWKLEASATCDIAGGKDQLGRYYFKIQGTDVAKHLLPIYNRLNGTFGYWRELTTTTFDNNSYIEIQLE